MVSIITKVPITAKNNKKIQKTTLTTKIKR